MCPERSLQLPKEEYSNERALLTRIKHSVKKPFDLSKDLLIRAHLYKQEHKQVYVLLLTIHHLVFDGASVFSLIKSLLKNYADLTKGKAIDFHQDLTTYADFINWQQQYLQSTHAETDLAYWRMQLSSNDLPVLKLPVDRHRSKQRNYRGTTYHTNLNSSVTAQLKQYIATQDSSLFVVLLAVYKILLYRYTGQHDLCIGAPTAGRSKQEFAEAIGYFVNMLPIRSQIDGSQSVSRFLEQLKLTVADAIDHGAYPFIRLVNALHASGDASHAQIFRASFALQNFLTTRMQAELQECMQSSFNLEVIESILQEGEFELTLEVIEKPDQLQLHYQCHLQFLLFLVK